MFRLPLSSPANPVGRSSFSTRGYKPNDSYITFSVGTISSDPEGYLSKNEDGDDVTVNIVGGIMSFSYPQFNSYVGVGDKVAVDGTDYYLNDKINASSWYVNTASGEVPVDLYDKTVVSINKAFSKLRDAIHGSSSGASVLLGTHNIKSLDKILRIAVYAMSDVIGNVEISPYWDVDETRFVRIFTPWDIRRDCNSKQRHNGIFGSGYDLTVNTSVGITMNSSYSEVEGLLIDCDSENNGIISGVYGEGQKILNNLIKNAGSYAVVSSGPGYIVGNIIYDCANGVENGAGLVNIINNTINNVTIGILGATSTKSYNNIIQNSTTSLSGLSSGNVTTTITDDGLLSSTNQTVVFRDETAKDFHLDYLSDDTLSPLSDGTPFNDNTDFLFDRDVDTEKVTSGWHIGADYFVPVAKFAIGFPYTDIKTGSPHGVVTDGVITFEQSGSATAVDQTDERLCVGCKVTIGAYVCFLHEKISDNSWKVADGSGLAPADNSKAAVTSIDFAYDNIYGPMFDDGSFSPGLINDSWTTGDLSADGINIELACTYGELYIGSDIGTDFDTDDSHFIKVFSPNNPGVDCNVTRRHDGVLDSSLCILHGVASNDQTASGTVTDGLYINADFCVIEGIQITADSDGIVAFNALSTKIDSCIIYDTLGDGIRFNQLEDDYGSVIANNIIYGCSEKGINIQADPYGDSDHNCNIYNNTVVSCDIGIYLEIFKYYDVSDRSVLCNNLVQDCRINYYSTQGRSDRIISITNYSSDTSIRNLYGTNDVESFTVEFRDKLNHDYHLSLYDSLRMESVTNLSADIYYPFDIDIDGESRSARKWDAGADNWSPSSGNLVTLSVGASVTDMASGISSMTIVDDIIEFVGDISDDMGVGDKVSYNDGSPKICYLSEKGTANKWLVRSNLGEANIADVALPISVTSITRTSGTLKDMIGKTTSDAEVIIGSTQDLVTEEIIDLFISLYEDDSSIDTGDITISGWTTSSVNVIRIASVWNTKTQCMSNQRNNGYWGDGGFRIEASSTTCIDIDQDYLSLSGARIKPLNNTLTSIVLGNNCDEVSVSSNIIKDSNIAIEQSLGAGGSVELFGNSIYDTVTSGINIRIGGAYNNTIVSDLGSGIKSNENVKVFNNLIQGSLVCYDDLDVGSEPTDEDYVLNIAEDASLPIINKNKNNATINFKDASSKDYRLDRSDFIAYNHGINLRDNGLLSFYEFDHVDIDSTWSIGADVDPGFSELDLYFSVSMNQSELRTAFHPVTGDSAKVVIVNGLASFTTDQDNPELGVGDTLTYDSSKTCYLFEKISEDQWEVRTKYGEIPDDELTEVEVTSIKHTFEKLSDAVNETNGIKYFFGDSNNPFLNLCFAKVRIHLSFFNSSDTQVQIDKVLIDDFVTSEDYYLRIFTPYDSLKYCNKRQLHKGFWDISKIMHSLIQPVSSVDSVVQVRSQYTTIEGIIISGNDSIYSGNTGILVEEAIGVKILGNIISDCYDGVQNDSGSYLYDNFEYGNKSSFWDTEFQDPSWPARRITSVLDNIVTQDASGDYNYINLTDPSSVLEDSFDFEFGIYIDNNYGSENFTIDFRIFAEGVSVPSAPQAGPGVIPSSLSHVQWSGEELSFGGESIWAPIVKGRVYKVRVVRGGYLTSEGVFTSDSSLNSVMRLYYFDDWQERDQRSGAGQPLTGGTGTNTWIKHPGDYSSVSDNFYIMINGSDRNGFSYFKFWAETGIASMYLQGLGSISASNIVSNIIYDCSNNGIDTGGEDVAYNNTIVDAINYGIDNTDGDYVTNCIIQNSGVQDFLLNTNILSCISSDSSAGSNEENISNESVTFLSQVSKNYHPAKSDDKVRGTGRYLIGDSLYPFNTDAKSALRGRSWDRGALEYEAVYKVCYAVGFDNNDTSTKNSFGILEYSVTNEYERSIITFSIPQTDSRFGIGNIVTSVFGDININGCLLYEKINDYTYYCTNKIGGMVPSETGSVDTITRPFKTLQNSLQKSGDIFSSDYLNSYDLTSIETNVKIACYDDEIDYSDSDTDNGILIDSIASDPDYFLRIFTPYNTETEVNSSQRHNGDVDSGYCLYVDDELWGISLYNVDYFEIEGLRIKSDYESIYTPYFSNGIEVNFSSNYFIYSNIIYECRGSGISALPKDGSGVPTINKDIIANNLIYDCVLDGVICGDKVELTNSNLYLYNNTIVNCQRGIYFRNLNSLTVANCLGVGNLVQDSKLQDYVSDNPHLADVFTLNYCLSSDSSASVYSGSGNIYNEYVEFTDRTNKKFNLNNSDTNAIDSSFDLSDDWYFSFSEDIIRRDRDEDLWDRGAFELVDVAGSGDLNFSPLTLVYDYATASNIAPYLTLYLREDEWVDIDTNVQFQTINELNQYLSDNSFIYDFYNINIYVQAEKVFGDVPFSLRTRDSSRDVLIRTDPRELTMLPASVTYGDGVPLIDDSSYQGDIRFESIKVYSDDAGTQTNLVDDTATAPMLTFVNSIVQLNNDSIIGNNPCVIRSFGSILIYRNNGNVSNLYLNKGGVPNHVIANSSIITYYDGGEIYFATTNISTDDEVHNCLGYNYSDDDFVFNNSPTKVFNSISDEDPLFKRAELTEREFVISEVMSDNFDPQINSPLVNSGSNDFVVNESLDLNIEYDIIGNTRIYDNDTVDIGPYETEVVNVFFLSDEITKILQDKLTLDYSRKIYTSTYDDVGYKDLYSKFIDNESYAVEFVREVKVIIRLKPNYKEFRLYSDKVNKLIYEFEAYYDNSSTSIIITKTQEHLGSMLNKIFKDGNYIFNFDEASRSLKVYVNDTYEKGLSGNKSVVKSVRFGGTGMFSG